MFYIDEKHNQDNRCQGKQPQKHLPGNTQRQNYGFHRGFRAGKSSLVFDTIAAEAQRQLTAKNSHTADHLRSQLDIS